MTTASVARGVAWSLAIGLTLAADAPAPGGRFTLSPEGLRRAYERADRLPIESRGLVFKSRVDAHWFEPARLWYRNDLKGGAREFLLVDAKAGTRAPAFDHARAAAALAKASGRTVVADRLPFDAIEFRDGGKAVEFLAGEVAWSCDLATYGLTKVEPRKAEPRPGPSPPPESSQGGPRRRPGRPDEPAGVRSPDGRWVAETRDDNVALRRSGGGDPITLSDNGAADFAYGAFAWSPDSKTLVACRIDPAEPKVTHLLESSPREGGRAKLHDRPYPLPGDKFPRHEMWLFDVEARKATKVDADPIDSHGPPRLRWSKDSARFTYEKTDRGHGRFRLIEVDAKTGKSLAIIDERSDTFVNTYNVSFLHHVEETGEILWRSERDGWAHLYLVDAVLGTVKTQITKGPWVVRGVDRVDDKAREVWFRGSGRVDNQDPYLVHHYRANFDGSGLIDLTPGDGQHEVAFSPDRAYYVDTYSRVDLPPVHELRRSADGSLVVALERADASALEASGWRPPEVFHAKGRDGRTDIWGIVHRPRDYDPSRKYPVIEDIYAGPHDSHVPKTFAAHRRGASLAELGFVVVQIDGMGTANRSKAFHDVCWHNVADAGLPDRIAWIKALAAKDPGVDLDRVGIHGTSAGGQSSTGALLFHPDFYKVAVSACGCHDNRMDKSSWNEQWMGYPVGPHYAANSNITHAGKLRGKLLLIVGEMDTNVPPESTLRLVDAFIRAKKDVDLLFLPGAGHTDGGPYGERRRRDFFVRHLHGLEPPDRNAEGEESAR